MSSIETGSSATSSSGSRMIARAITTRCFCPPDRSRGYLVKNSSTGESPTRSRASTTRVRRSVADLMPWTRSGVRHRLLDGHRRVERGVGVLEHHLDDAAELAQLGAGSGRPRSCVRVQVDRAVRRGHQAEQRPAQRGLAAAALADQPDHLAGPQGRG